MRQSARGRTKETRYICIYIYIYTYTHIHIYVYIHIQRHAFLTVGRSINTVIVKRRNNGCDASSGISVHCPTATCIDYLCASGSIDPDGVQPANSSTHSTGLFRWWTSASELRGAKGSRVRYEDCRKYIIARATCGRH